MRQISAILLIAASASLISTTFAQAQSTINITDVSSSFNNTRNPPTATVDATFSATGLPDGNYELTINSYNNSGGTAQRTTASVVVTNGSGSITNYGVSISNLQQGDSGYFQFIISSVDGKWYGTREVDWQD